MILWVFTVDQPKRRRTLPWTVVISSAISPVRPTLTEPMVSRPVTAAAGQEASILILSGTSFPAQVPVRLRPALALVLTHTEAAALRLHAQEGTHWPLTGGRHTITPVRAQRRAMLLPTWTG